MYRQFACVAVIAAAVLGTASLAQAGSDRNEGPSGYQVQTWADIERDRQDMARKVEALEHGDKAGSSYGYLAPHVRRHPHR
jgi:hypothetical protein